MEENKALREQILPLTESKNKHKNKACRLLRVVENDCSAISPKVQVKKRNIEPDIMGSINSQIEACFPPKVDRGESFQPASLFVQDLKNIDEIQASNRAQQWKEERRILSAFKQSLLDVVYVLLYGGKCGPIPIHMNDRTVLQLTMDNLHVLADIVDPKFDSELRTGSLSQAHG